MCLSLYDYQSKASIDSYRMGFTYLRNKVTTNQKHTIDSQKPKRREVQYKRKSSNHKREKQKEKRDKEEIKNQQESKA